MSRAYNIIIGTELRNVSWANTRSQDKFYSISRLSKYLRITQFFIIHYANKSIEVARCMCSQIGVN